MTAYVQETRNFGLKPVTHNNLEKQTECGHWRGLEAATPKHLREAAAQSTRLLTGNQEQEPAGPVQNLMI